MKSNKVTLSLRRKMQRALNGKLYIERYDGVEDDEIHKLYELFPSLFSRITKEKSVYDIQITLRRLT